LRRATRHGRDDDIDHGRVGVVGFGQRVGGRRVGRFQRRVAAVLQVQHQSITVEVVVVNDED